MMCKAAARVKREPPAKAATARPASARRTARPVS